MYLRFAFYEDRKTGIPNAPQNMIHLLTAADKAAIWENLKDASALAKPLAGGKTPPAARSRTKRR